MPCETRILLAWRLPSTGLCIHPDAETEAEKEAERQDPQTYLRGSSTGETQAVMAELAATEASWKTGPALHSSEQSTAKSAPGDAAHTAHYSTGEAAASFTSTHFTPRTRNTAAALDDDAVRCGRLHGSGPAAHMHFLFPFSPILTFPSHSSLATHPPFPPLLPTSPLLPTLPFFTPPLLYISLPTLAYSLVAHKPESPATTIATTQHQPLPRLPSILIAH